MWMLALSWMSTLALAADAPKTLCDGKIGAEALTCIEANYPADHKAVEAFCEDPANGPRRTCRVARYAEVSITFVGNPEKEAPDAPTQTASSADGPVINNSALTSAATTLRVAGQGLKMLPTLCGIGNVCKLTSKDKSLIASFADVVTGAGDKVPAILASDATDADKASRLLGVAARLQAGVPTGLSDSAQGMVKSGVEAVQGVMPVLLSLGGKK